MAEQLLILGRQAQAVSAVFARRYSSLTPAAGENVEASVRPSCPGTGDLGRSTVFDIRGASVERRTRESVQWGWTLRVAGCARHGPQRRPANGERARGRGAADVEVPRAPRPAWRRGPLLSRLAGQAPVRVVLDPRSPMDDRGSVRPCRARWRSSCRVSGRTGCRSTRSCCCRHRPCCRRCCRRHSSSTGTG